MKDLEEKAEEARAKLEELAATLSPRQTELERGISQLDQDFRTQQSTTKPPSLRWKRNLTLCISDQDMSPSLEGTGTLHLL